MIIDTVIPIDHLIQSKRRTIGLEVDQDAKLIVRAPLRCPPHLIRHMVEKHREWIIRRQKYAREHYQPVIPKKYIAGEVFLYLGKMYKLTLDVNDEATLNFDGSQFTLGLNQLENALRLFQSWYKQEAYKITTERAAVQSIASGIKYHRIRITSAQHRWGSCGSKGNLNFPWRLVMAPMEVIDGVIMHELVHVKVSNHSRKFWAKLNDLVPDYKSCIRWLKDNYNALSLEY